MSDEPLRSLEEHVESAAGAEPAPATGRKGLRALTWLLLLAGLLLILGWLGWKAWRAYDLGTSLLGREAQARALLAAGPQAMDPAAAGALVNGLRQDVVALQEEAAFALPLLPLLHNVPGAGPLAQAAPPLLEMADAGTAAAAHAFRALEPALVAWQEGGDAPLDLGALLATVQAGGPDLARTAQELERLAAARARIPDDAALPGQVQELLALSDAWLPRAQDGLRAALALPELAGADGPRRYLILAQNADELRPSGGFISGAGLVQIDNGRITALEFEDANKIDAWQNPSGYGELTKPYADAPAPLRDFMLLDLFLFRDANYWPDFRASGQKALDLYAYGRDIPPLDGAIAINQEFLRLLLSATGPVTIADTGEVIDSGNVLASLQDAWSLQEGVTERKAFLGPFAAAIMGKLLGGLEGIDPLALGLAVEQALTEKHLQVYVRDPEAATLLGANGWDGRLQPPVDHDALMVVDTNAGYNKANAFVTRDVRYDVRLAPSGGEADLTVTHRHLGQPSEEACWQGTEDVYLAGGGYDALADKCYWNYLRVYTPAGSELISGPTHVIPGQTWFGGYDWAPPAETLAELPGFTTFTTWFLLPRGADVTSAFQYRLPETVTQESGAGFAYALQLYKQAGVDPHLVQVRVTLPEGMELLTADPRPTAREGDTLFFNIDLAGDQRLSLRYR